MSESKAPDPGNIYSRRDTNVAELEALYPSQFSIRMISCDWPNGWHDIVQSACGFAANHPGIRWHQIKEKFGGLRMYHGGAPEHAVVPPQDEHAAFFVDAAGRPVCTFSDIIFVYQSLSEKTCALCGATHQNRRVENRRLSGWWITLCDECVPLVEAYRQLPWDGR